MDFDEIVIIHYRTATLQCVGVLCLRSCLEGQSLKPGFHSIALALRELRKRKPQETQAFALASSEPIMVSTASTKHSYWQALA